MPCTHMKKLYQLVEQYDMKLGSSDLIRIVCPHCQMEETCPDRLMGEIDDQDEQEAEDGKVQHPPANQEDR